MSHLFDLQPFFPQDIEIVRKIETPRQLKIKLKSRTISQICPKCGYESTQYHSTYIRTITDLPIFGKAVVLRVTIYKYDCENKLCEQKVFCEELSGFTGKYRRMTARCEDLVASIALNTSCETASAICKHMGIEVSGDTAIRILRRNAELTHRCGEIIGVDDWALKKRGRYGTIVCDYQTGKPISDKVYFSHYYGY